MPRMELTEAEAEIIKARRHKNAERIAHNKALELAKEVVRELLTDPDANNWPIGEILDKTLEKLDLLKEPEL